MMRYPNIIYRAFILLSFFHLGEVNAADIEFLSEVNEYGCQITLSGEISAGDAADLEYIQDQIWPGVTGANEGPGDGGTICLDSPGGSLREAILLAQVRNGTTVIPPNSRCESACAIVFMAGNINQTPSRKMFISSRLGFHAPSLIIEGDAFSSAAVAQAYDVAIETIAQVSSLNILPQSAMTLFASTPSSTMHYISNFSEVVSNQIQLVEVNPNTAGIYARRPFSLIPDISVEEIFQNACINYYRENFYDREPRLRSYDPVEIISVNDESEWTMFIEGAVYIHNAEDYYAPCNVSLQVSVSDYSPGSMSATVSLEGFGRENSWTNTHFWPREALFSISEANSIPLEIFQERLLALSGTESELDCAVGTAVSEVINVNEYVNIRSSSSLQAPIVARASLGEHLIMPQPNQWWYQDTPLGRRCSNLCDQYYRESSNNTLVPQLRQCIEDAQIWQQVSNSRGQTGYVSVYFLESMQ